MSEIYETREGFQEGSAGPQPEHCTEAHLTYLDDLRRANVTNMFGARPWLMNAFPELSGREAAAVCAYWMRTPRPAAGE